MQQQKGGNRRADRQMRQGSGAQAVQCNRQCGATGSAVQPAAQPAGLTGQGGKVDARLLAHLGQLLGCDDVVNLPAGG